jgi:hypothetical protein
MSTQSWSTRLRHDSDATWQEWRDEFITRLGALTELAADETNITPGAGARPGSNTEGGYAVFHLNDALHGTAPIYIRFGFGTAGGATAPRVQVTVGTSTNGSGVLGGTALSTIANIATFGVGETSDTAKQSYFSANEGFFGLNWKVQDSNANVGSFFICRTCDADGEPTAVGALAHWGSGVNSSLTKRQAFRYASPAAAYTAQVSITDAALGMNPQAQSSTVVGSDPQAMLGYTITPRVEPLAYVCGVRETEAAEGSTFSVAMVGATARTFLVMHERSGNFSAQTGVNTELRMAMLWE